MKILVTGICGRLGSAIANLADEMGHEIVGFDIVPWPAEKKGPAPASLTFVEGSYGDTNLLAKHMPGCDAIVHTGGPHGGCMESHDIGGFIEGHTVWVSRMLEMAREVGVKSVALSSTMEVQIGRDWSSSGAAYLTEESPVRADSKYALSRILMETLAKQYTTIYDDISIACLRYMAFGYGDDRKAGPNLLARTVPCRDVARAVLMVCQRTDLKGDVFNIGPKTPITAQDIGKATKNPKAILEKYYPGASAVLEDVGIELASSNFWPITSIHKAKVILGWEPEYSFEKWLKENGWTGAPAEEPAATTA